MRRKAFTVIIAAVALLGLIGCQSNTAVDVPITTPTAVPTVTEEPKATEAPTLTEEPKATEVPTPTEEPKATEAPALTEEPKATEAPAPTEEPKATEAPAPTEEPKATEAPAPTEEPKATEAPAPTKTPSAAYTLQEMAGFEGQAYAADGGVIAYYSTNGLYGTRDYNGKDILPAQYRWISHPDANGNVAAIVRDEEIEYSSYILYVYDKSGKELYQATCPYGYSVQPPSDGKILYWTNKSVDDVWNYAVRLYDYENDKMIFEMLRPRSGDSYAELMDIRGMHDGYASVIEADVIDGEPRFRSVLVDFEGNTTEWSYSYYSEFGFRVIGAPNDGYIPVIWSYDASADPEGALAACEAYIGIMSVDGKEVYLLSAEEFICDYIGNIDGYRVMVDNYAWADGNQGAITVDKQMVISYEDKKYLIDFSKGKNTSLNGKEQEYADTMKTEYGVNTVHIVKSADVVLGEYAILTLSDEGYHLACDNDGKWIHLNSDGSVKKSYEDCSDMRDGYASVVEDGMLYIVNDKYEKITDGYQATGASNCGDGVFSVSNGEETYAMILKK